MNDLNYDTPKYMNIRDISVFMGVCEKTMKGRLKEFKLEIAKERYPKSAYIADGNIVRINTYAIIDYMSNRRALMDRNLRKYVKPFNAREIAIMVNPITN